MVKHTPNKELGFVLPRSCFVSPTFNQMTVEGNGRKTYWTLDVENRSQLSRNKIVDSSEGSIQVQTPKKPKGKHSGGMSREHRLNHSGLSLLLVPQPGHSQGAVGTSKGEPQQPEIQGDQKNWGVQLENRARTS